MKTMCPSVYHPNGFVVTHALGHIMYGLYILLTYVYQLPPLRFNSCPTVY